MLLSWSVIRAGYPEMVGSARRHGCSPTMGKWKDLLLPGRQLLEVQWPVSPPCPALPYFQTLHGRLRLSAFPSRCSRLALWLLSIKPSPSKILELFRICAREMFPKESDSIKQHFGKTGVQVGEFEEQLVIERTISANPFLVITLKHLGITWFFFRIKRPKKILGWVMRCWMWSHLMSEGKFWNGEETQKLLSRGSQEITNEALHLVKLG